MDVKCLLKSNNFVGNGCELLINLNEMNEKFSIFVANSKLINVGLERLFGFQ